ncbi:hypothetical protein BC936DRAFT_143720 [Jimgerdemannia flammicorona]|uniref:Uncharacterized protein n=2 Tax=Jimgerdemannia flammicorona TaxID=994334 RepID=A0A432ZZ32_9FUNG|nr:hypothetical protein BC936DRAFT_143720 [Jimgerdemannia flammicorona]RUS13992.1 hypothetical protein BC938DRAFT_477583 [Jimgerdemannia flammicorona]
MSFRDIPKLPILSIFHNPSCSKSCAALRLLESAVPATATIPAYRIDVVDYIKEPPTATQLRLAAQFLGLKGEAVQAMLRPDAPRVRDVDDVIRIIEEQPAILERPLVIDWEAGKAVIGRPPEKVQELIRERVTAEE